MSLTKQLWLLILLLLLAAFAGVLVSGSRSTQTYLTEQLYQRNVDASNQLALAISSAGADPVTAELLISAQFDIGHYRRITLTDAEGELLIERIAGDPEHPAPAWFVTRFPIEPEPGTAFVNNGWQQMGQISVESQTAVAYDQLWANARTLFYYFGVMALIGVAITALLLNVLLTPLRNSVEQASAIGDRRFIKIPEPRTPEFRQLATAMNRLSDRVRNLLRDETAKLEKLREATQNDPLTHLLNREACLKRIDGLLARNDEQAHGTILATRLRDLGGLNVEAGRDLADRMLAGLGQRINARASHVAGAFGGRLNGAELVLALPAKSIDEIDLAEYHGELTALLEKFGLGDLGLAQSVSLPYLPDDQTANVLKRIDDLFTQIRDGRSATATFEPSRELPERLGLGEWKARLDLAFREHQFSLSRFPVRDRNSRLLHNEAPIRLGMDDEHQVSAAHFIHWLDRLGWAARLDQEVIRLAIPQLEALPEDLAIHLSGQLLSDPAACDAVISRLREHPTLVNRLWIEMSEPAVMSHLDAFRSFAKRLKQLGCRVGIEHAGPEFSRLGQLYDVGLDYLKVDRSLVREIDQHQGNQLILRSLCTVVHAIGCRAIAEGVGREEEWNALMELGFDGGTGPLVR